MIVDGKALTQEIKENLKEYFGAKEGQAVLSLVVVGENSVTEKFVRAKQKFGTEIGVLVEVERFTEDVKTEELISAIENLTQRKTTGGIVVQLPLPEKINSKEVLDAVPENLDVDVLSSISNRKLKENNLPVLPPVTGAVKYILEKYGIALLGKNVVVLGKGRLVGAPTALWLTNSGADVVVLDRETQDRAQFTKNADIIVAGAGVPSMITPEIIKEGVVLIDAGTSEDNGILRGDIDPKCKEKATLFTPVPGGVGPMTVALLFQNLKTLTVKSTDV